MNDASLWWQPGWRDRHKTFYDVRSYNNAHLFNLIRVRETYAFHWCIDTEKFFSLTYRLVKHFESHSEVAHIHAAKVKVVPGEGWHRTRGTNLPSWHCWLLHDTAGPSLPLAVCCPTSAADQQTRSHATSAWTRTLSTTHAQWSGDTISPNIWMNSDYLQHIWHDDARNATMPHWITI